MNIASESWLRVDDLLDANFPRQVFSGAQGLCNAASAPWQPLAASDFPACWRALTIAAHEGLEQCAALLSVPLPLPTDANELARLLEQACDRLELAAHVTAPSLLPRICVLAGLTGRLIRDAYEYANMRVVMGGALIGYQLICAKLADMVIADEIIEQRLIAVLDASPRKRADAGWRGVPVLHAQAHVGEIVRCTATVLSLSVDIHAGHAFVQRATSVPILAVAQALLDGIQAAMPGRT
ncbi:hypothetical protein [Herbaspirillum seropedicae]|uniref:hypothetical protein n=1 Tax=Herbaspirillum seropedicae TaxID=964 RepID=UPI000847DA91|nr:hypothetical protein [Herbaspirillum seropedicae]